VGLLSAAALISIFIKRRVIQVPAIRVAGLVVGLMCWLVLTLAFSRFFSISLTELAEWLTYGLTFFAIVAGAGRRQGPVLILAAIVFGCTILAITGLFEYRDVRAIDPTWRVFSSWTPNSLAGILSMGLLLALGLSMFLERWASLLFWCCAIAMSFCIVLTQSRGGLLSLGAGLLVLSFFAVSWRASIEQAMANMVRVGSVVLLMAGFAGLIVLSSRRPIAAAVATPGFVLAQQTTPTPAPATSPLSRMKMESGEQSTGFRTNLWKGAIKLISQNLLGTGIGTYRFESAKPGLTTQTHLTHNTYLQLGVEGGWLALLGFPALVVLWMLEVSRGSYRALRPKNFIRAAAFVALVAVALWKINVLGPNLTTGLALMGAAGFWLYLEAFRGSANLVPRQNILRAAIIAAVICALVDNLFDSGLYSFGIGWVFFALLGLGLVEAADGVAPEFIPKLPRYLVIVGATMSALILFHAGVVETVRARARFERDSNGSFGAESGALALAHIATSLAPYDGENWRLLASLEPSTMDHNFALRRAAELHPNTRNLRAYGIALMDERDFPRAEAMLNKALEQDPNNLLTLSRLLDSYMKENDLENATEMAKRMARIEDTDYFKVRSLPELVPVETFAARTLIASTTRDPQERLAQLEKAVDGYQQYLHKTVPVLLQMAKSDPSNPNREDIQFGGESLKLARSKMAQATESAQFLADTYRQMKRPADAQRADAMAQEFAAVANGTS
jgi:tetratricopeptide (TPR) repeat protein